MRFEWVCGRIVSGGHPNAISHGLPSMGRAAAGGDAAGRRTAGSRHPANPRGANRIARKSKGLTIALPLRPMAFQIAAFCAYNRRSRLPVVLRERLAIETIEIDPGGDESAAGINRLCPRPPTINR